MRTELNRDNLILLIASLFVFYTLPGCGKHFTRSEAPIIELRSKERGVIVHAEVNDPKHEHIRRFELAETGENETPVLSYEGNKPMHAMLIAVHTGNNTDTIHDEADGFDQFLLASPNLQSSFSIRSGKQYRATACSSSGRCTSAAFTLTEGRKP